MVLYWRRYGRVGGCRCIFFLMRTSKAKFEFRKICTPCVAKRSNGVTTAILSEDERKRSLRLENKHTLRSIAKQWCYHITLDESERSEAWILVKKYTSTSEARWWCYHKRFHIRYSFGEDERCWSSNLQISLLRQKALTTMYLENCIPNEKLYKYFIIRHPRY